MKIHGESMTIHRNPLQSIEIHENHSKHTIPAHHHEPCYGFARFRERDVLPMIPAKNWWFSSTRPVWPDVTGKAVCSGNANDFNKSCPSANKSEESGFWVFFWRPDFFSGDRIFFWRPDFFLETGFLMPQKTQEFWDNLSAARFRSTRENSMNNCKYGRIQSMGRISTEVSPTGSFAIDSWEPVESHADL